jgi:hypothetical protein
MTKESRRPEVRETLPAPPAADRVLAAPARSACRCVYFFSSGFTPTTFRGSWMESMMPYAFASAAPMK